ncbi:hypothetical protein MKW98_032593 [Papaver atlanticum]|uniref:Cobalamin-independent methionine synthase MetE C-terminal/archaeal domain-containing protein n=1 Tax=Papaver atlanticum TaxID=357466 RepID=A0AAD4SUR0_9MAGN|nr:hypothetical protein MKW98_032593 [Papaver atlanticum]
MAFAAQRVLESGQKDEKSSPRVTNESVQKAATALRGSDHRRATNLSSDWMLCRRLKPSHPPNHHHWTFPLTMELRIVRECKANKIFEADYAGKKEISEVIKLREELDIDVQVQVHGEPERNDLVEYFREQLSCFAFSINGWVQSYCSRMIWESYYQIALMMLRIGCLL